MNVRRPDAHTLRQRHAARVALFVEGIDRQIKATLRQNDIRAVYISEVRRGTNCKVLT